MHEAETPDQSEPPPRPQPEPHAYAVFRNADFTRYLISRFIATFGMQMLVTTLDWELYKRTHSGLALGFVGLALMVPMFLFTLPAGHLADRRNRKSIILGGTFAMAMSSLALAVVSFLIPMGQHLATFKWCAYAIIVGIGVSRTFLWPASAAFISRLVSREELPRAVTFNSGAFQLACVLGPSAAGALIWWTQLAWPVYAINVVFGVVCVALIKGVRHVHKEPPHEPFSPKTLITGFNFVFHNKIILGTITLDMFAVLLGGAVTLLPIFADVVIPLHAGADGLGLGILRAAIPIGAIACVFFLAHRPPLQKAGRALLWCVAIFGLATIFFGLANRFCLGRYLALSDQAWFGISFAMMALCGVVDNVSVVVRQTLVQILTPDEKRGRVSAVNSLFIGTSNELGGFESGLSQHLLGPALGHTMATGAILSTVVGGFGTILVVIAVAWIWPEIRRYGRLE
jgi:MFS family permease